MEQQRMKLYVVASTVHHRTRCALPPQTTMETTSNCHTYAGSESRDDILLRVNMLWRASSKQEGCLPVVGCVKWIGTVVFAE